MSFIFLFRFPVGNGTIPAVKEQFPIEINKESRKYLSKFRHYKIFCVNGKYGIQVEFRIFYFIALQNEEDYERKESRSA